MVKKIKYILQKEIIAQVNPTNNKEKQIGYYLENNPGFIGKNFIIGDYSNDIQAEDVKKHWESVQNKRIEIKNIFDKIIHRKYNLTQRIINKQILEEIKLFLDLRSENINPINNKISLFLFYNLGFLLSIIYIPFLFKIVKAFFFGIEFGNLPVIAFSFLFITGISFQLFTKWINIFYDKRLYK